MPNVAWVSMKTALGLAMRMSHASATWGEGEGESEGWSGECGRSVPSRQIVKPARRRRTWVAEENVLCACPYVHVRVCVE